MLPPGGGRAGVGGGAEDIGVESLAGLEVTVAWMGPVGTPATERCVSSANLLYISPLVVTPSGSLLAEHTTATMGECNR